MKLKGIIPYLLFELFEIYAFSFLANMRNLASS